jgi:hypothetical protein
MITVRLGVTVCAVLASALVVVACGDDDKGPETSPSPTLTVAASRSVTPSPSVGVDEKSPAPAETPGGEATPGPADTPPPIATTGKRAPKIDDVAAFFAQFPIPPQDERQCVYNPGNRVLDCAVRGLYAPDPPPTGQGVECFFMTADGNPAAARCEIASLQSTAYYDVR